MPLLSMAILAAAGAYDMRTFRSSTGSPDATHSVMQESHGVQRFKTTEQRQIFMCLNIARVASFAVEATSLFLDKQLNKLHA